MSISGFVGIYFAYKDRNKDTAEYMIGGVMGENQNFDKLFQLSKVWHVKNAQLLLFHKNVLYDLSTDFQLKKLNLGFSKETLSLRLYRQKPFWRRAIHKI